MTVTRDIAATRERVWEVLANGWTYSGWVVSNSRIRAVDSNRPAPGTRILHSIGTWPAVINDETVVHSDLPGGQCRVAMTEVAASRPLSWVPDSVQLLGVAPRNRECTWRVAMIAEQHVPPT
jgi:hypothetical protein